jgi:hypothetical protein
VEVAVKTENINAATTVFNKKVNKEKLLLIFLIFAFDSF